MEVDKTIYNPFEQELVDNGYGIDTDHIKESVRIFQRRFTDDKGIKYHLTCYHYRWQDYEHYSFTAQFRIDKDGRDQTIDIRYSADFLPNKYREVTTLKEVEEFFESMFLTTKADYYETI